MGKTTTKTEKWQQIAERCLRSFRIIKAGDETFYGCTIESPYVVNLENEEFADEVKTYLGLNEHGFKTLLPFLRKRAERREVFSRAGIDKDGKLFIDLGPRNGFAKMDPSQEGWEITHECPILFRKNGSKPLPKPEKEPAENLTRYLSELFTQLDEEQLKLTAGFMIGCFVPSGTKPLLVITGRAGSGKTCLSKWIKQIIDPVEVPTKPLPKKFDISYALTAETELLLAFDNVSTISDEMSDTLCRTASGSGIQSRKFYSQKTGIIHRFRNPIILNGLGSIVVKGDLRSRCIFIDIERTPDRKPEGILDRKFHLLRPKILGALFTGLHRALANFDAVRLKYNHRLADFVQWVVASEAIEGFEEIFRQHTINASLQAVKESPNLKALAEEVKKRGGEVSGEAQELVRLLNLRLVPNQLRSFLETYAEDLKNVGINFELPTKRTSRSRGLFRIWHDGCDEPDS